ncbi:MAG TPA: hypothetical protein VGY53_12555 [Isosphaeraceae bacterium]|jgi:hypothetical protein|nr:hypothetical protein [Isosphaeraceae bacterium]
MSILPDDLRTARDRLSDLAGALDRAHESQPECALALVAVTFQESSYPTQAKSLFACKIQLVSGQETEGAAGVLTATTATIYAYNLGSAIPPQGTAILATQVGDRWTFRYDG